MGGYLDRPVLDRFTEQGTNDYISYGSSAVQGWRCNQEDAHINTLDLVDGVAFFAVFDGHGGGEVARYCASALPLQFIMQPAFYTSKDFSKALHDAFFQVDKNILSNDVKLLLQQIASYNEEQQLKKIKTTAANKRSTKSSKRKDTDPQQILAKPISSVITTTVNCDNDSPISPSSSPEVRVLKRGRAFKADDKQRRRSNHYKELHQKYQWAAATCGDVDPNEGIACTVTRCLNVILSVIELDWLDSSEDEDDDYEDDEDLFDSSYFKSDLYFKSFVGEQLEEVDDFCWDDTESASEIKDSSLLSNLSDENSSVLSTPSNHPQKLSTFITAQHDEFTESTKKRPSSDIITETINDSIGIASGDNGMIASSILKSSNHDLSTKLAAQSGYNQCSKRDTSSDGLTDDKERKKPRRSTDSVMESISTPPSIEQISNDTSSTDQLLNTKCKDEVFFADDIISPVDKSESSKTNNEPQSSDVNDGNCLMKSAENESSFAATQSRSSVISGIEAINILRNIAPISLMCSTKKDPGVNSGCTAIVAVLLENKKLIVANAGDSRGVLCRNGQAVALSQDHNPEVLGERIRIINAGRRVTSDGRIDRGLNLSRSIGDHNYKNNSELPPHMQAIICKPDICVIDIEQDDEFFVLACDGIWNCKTNQQVCDIIREWLPLKSLGQICEDICSQCIAVSTDGDGSGCDNMTIIIVQIKHSTANGQAKQSEIVYGSNSTENRVERSEKFTTTSTPNSDDENRRIMTSLEQPVTDISF